MRALRGAVAVAGLAALAAWAPSAMAAGEPVNRGAPVVSGANNTLSTTDGTWVGVTRPFTYAWLRCADTSPSSCIEVPGQTTSTYPVTGLDAGSRIRSQVTGSNIFGSTAALSEPTAAFPVSQPAPARGPTAVPRLSPFPVVVVTGRVRGKHTRITGMLVRGPAGARVAVRCGGRCSARALSATIGAKRRLRLHRAERVYRAGAVLEVRVTARGRIGKFTRFRLRAGQAPVRADRCLAPGSSQASAC